MLKSYCQVNKQDLCHKERAVQCAWRGTAWAAWPACARNMVEYAAILPSPRRRVQSHRRVTELGWVWKKGVQDRRDAGGPVSPSGPQSSSAEKCEVRCIGHAISAVCQASRGVQRFVEPARLQVCAHAYDVRGALSGAPGSQCLQSKVI